MPTTIAAQRVCHLPQTVTQEPVACPQDVAISPDPFATVSGMTKWGDYWKTVCAPKLKAKKAELGRGVPEREIAAAVEAATGKPSERSLVNMWLHGEREPFISQFFALCEKLGADPAEVLKARKSSHVPGRIFSSTSKRVLKKGQMV